MAFVACTALVIGLAGAVSAAPPSQRDAKAQRLVPAPQLRFAHKPTTQTKAAETPASRVQRKSAPRIKAGQRIGPLAPAVIPPALARIPGVQSLAELLAWQSGRPVRVLALSRSAVLSKLTWRFSDGKEPTQTAWLSPSGRYVTFAPVLIQAAMDHLHAERASVRCLNKHQVRVLLPASGVAAERQRQALGPWVDALGISCDTRHRCKQEVGDLPVWLGGATRHVGVLSLSEVARRWGCR